MCVEPPEPTTGEPVYSCTGWDPEAGIDLIMGVHYVDANLVTDLINDQTALLACDDATVNRLVGAGFEIADANSGEMLYELGLRNGDIPLDLNGYPLETYQDAWIAFMELWVIEGETVYSLEISRNSASVTLDYEITFTL